eukprot:CAMPEP_0180662108 /NCGR_PEP_ID=MMETSP1037_2-20121125/59212_1 /TAXON_ID=632150 /ORGANISM="Azadinium spinosum, Strain 3D9" /LENGTH=64 /DNA_ID=CAMNT_0022689741 /DNA_START=123 /DNA_END=317 /DNA_ORIENTATION=+
MSTGSKSRAASSRMSASETGCATTAGGVGGGSTPRSSMGSIGPRHGRVRDTHESRSMPGGTGPE